MQNGEPTVAMRLRSLRERRGWSQTTLRQRSGVANSTISRIESGEIASPGIDVLRRLSVALGVDLSEISGEHPMPKRRVEIFAPTGCAGLLGLIQEVNHINDDWPTGVVGQFLHALASDDIEGPNAQLGRPLIQFDAQVIPRRQADPPLIH